MGTAPNSVSQTTPLMARLVEDCIELRQSGNGGNSVDPNGPYGRLISDIEKAFQQFFGDSPSNQQAAASPQASMMTASSPTPYSMSAIPSHIQSDPASQLSPDDMARMQRLSNNATMMAASFRPSISPAGTDLRGTQGGTVRDHRGVGSPVIVSPSNNPIVRDHRHPPLPGPPSGSPATPPTGSTLPPPASVPPSSAPPSSGNTGTSFTSASDYNSLSQANSSMESAKQALLDDPTNPAKQLAFQEAAQTLQLLFNMLTQISSMKASMADAAIKAMKVSPA